MIRQDQNKVKKIQDMAQYQIVIIGYPIWAEDTPQAIKGFIKAHHLKGKTVIQLLKMGKLKTDLVLHNLGDYCIIFCGVARKGMPIL